MEYVYTAMLLHKAGKKVTEESVKHVLTAAGVHCDEARIKALVAALDGVNIDEAIAKAAVVAAAPVAAVASEAPKKHEEKKEEKKDDGAAAAGLGALFG